MNSSLIPPSIQSYNDAQTPADGAICEMLAREISRGLSEAERKI